MAATPLARGQLARSERGSRAAPLAPALIELAELKQRTAAEVAIRWCLQQGAMAQAATQGAAECNLLYELMLNLELHQEEGDFSRGQFNVCERTAKAAKRGCFWTWTRLGQQMLVTTGAQKPPVGVKITLLGTLIE